MAARIERLRGLRGVTGLIEPPAGSGPVAAKLTTMTEAWVYLLRCRDGSLYTGWTIDLHRRLARHQAGSASRYTASRRPVQLAVMLPMPSRTEARREEARIKRLDRAAKLALIASETGPAAGQLSRGAGAKTIRLSSVRALPPRRNAV